MVKKCPYCDSRLVDNTKVCPYCGMHLESSTDKSSFNYQNIMEKINNLDSHNKKRVFILMIILLIIDGVMILTLFDINIDGSKSENMTCVLSGVTCEHVNNTNFYALSADIFINKCPSSFEGYTLKQTYYDSNNNTIGFEIESLDYKYSNSASGERIYLNEVHVYKEPDPYYVSIEIMKEGELINNYTFEINRNQLNLDYHN